MLLVNTHLAEAYGTQKGATCRVLGKHARQQFPETRALSRFDKRLHRHTASPTPPCFTRHVNGELSDTGIALARPVCRSSSERHHVSILLDNHNLVNAIEPGQYILFGA